MWRREWQGRKKAGDGTFATFACKDIGMQCGFTASAPTGAELLPKIAELAASAHNIRKIEPAMEARIEAAIKK